jgi:hypothetical protein
MEEAPENSKESSHSAHAIGMNVNRRCNIAVFTTQHKKLGVKTLVINTYSQKPKQMNYHCHKTLKINVLYCYKF